MKLYRHFECLFLWDNLLTKEAEQMEKSQKGSEPIVSVKTQYLLLLLLLQKEDIMYNNPYMTNISLNERIDNEIERLKQMKTQVQQPTPITQNFQLAPTNRDVIRYATSIDEVQRDMVIGDTPYFSKDMSVVWIKNTKGDIKTYELNEVVLKDEKDMKIDFLMAQIEELKKEMKDNESNANVDESIESEKSADVQTISKSSKKAK